MRIRSSAVVSTLVMLVAGGAGTTHAQWPPERLENLEVLSPDTPVRELVGIMRGFAGGLGVRCTHCHVGENSNDLSSIDFVSDEKPAKRKARAMLRMVQAINDDLLAEVPDRSDPPVEVTCATCHHGVAKPVSIQEVLLERAESDGAAAAIGEYQELRERYYGSYSYDFRDFVIPDVAESLAGSDPSGAIELLEFNAGLFPESITTFFTMAQVHLSRADTAQAVAALERAAAVDPENAFIQRTLQRLRGN